MRAKRQLQCVQNDASTSTERLRVQDRDLIAVNRAAIVKRTARTEVNNMNAQSHGKYATYSLYIPSFYLWAPVDSTEALHPSLCRTFEILHFQHTHTHTKRASNNSTSKLCMETFLPQLCMLAFECGFSGIQHPSTAIVIAGNANQIVNDCVNVCE